MKARSRRTSKKSNFRFARKRANKWRSNEVTQDSMRACRRNYGEGLGR